jgi:hypothetical protein
MTHTPQFNVSGTVAMNAGLAKALGVMLKLDFERAVLNRVPAMEKHPEGYFRQVLFLCDEYQHFATVGESEPTGDEKFFSLSRQPKCIPIIATQRVRVARGIVADPNADVSHQDLSVSFR